MSNLAIVYADVINVFAVVYVCTKNDVFVTMTLLPIKIFNDKFKEYGIKSYDMSTNREEVLNYIVEYLKDQ